MLPGYRPELMSLEVNRLVTRLKKWSDRAAALDYLSATLRPLRNSLAQKVAALEREHEGAWLALWDFLEVSQIRSPSQAAEILKGMIETATDDQLTDALAGEFESSHAHMKMREDVVKLRSVTQRFLSARAKYHAERTRYRAVKDLYAGCERATKKERPAVP